MGSLHLFMMRNFIILNIFLTICSMKNTYGYDKEELDKMKAASNATSDTRTEKQFSLFTIVTFPNDQCTAASGSSTGAKKGTCLSSTECNSKSGTADGNCASGFGVCCTFRFTACGKTITENCTYIQNPGYSSSYTTSGSCSTSVTPISSNICQIRLDFDTFSTTIASADGTCTDSFTVTGPSNTNSLPVLCGKLTGQHLYFENARSTSSSTLAFTISTTTTGATYSIKVSQIECSSISKPPNDCNMYHTGISGFIQSYNWQGGEQITGAKFSTCIRREDGYCSISYVPVQGQTIDTFQLDDIVTTSLMTTASSITWSAALEGYILIAGAQGTSAGFSAEILSDSVLATTDTVVHATGPRFIVTHIVSGTVHANDGDTGYYLQYQQIACGAEINRSAV